MMFLKARKRRTEAHVFLTQMANQWTMDRLRNVAERRGEQRANLNVGVWLVPMQKAAPVVLRAFVAGGELQQQLQSVRFPAVGLHEQPLPFVGRKAVVPFVWVLSRQHVGSPLDFGGFRLPLYFGCYIRVCQIASRFHRSPYFFLLVHWLASPFPFTPLLRR